MPYPIFVRRADLTFPANCDAPIAASLTFSAVQPADSLTAEFDWRQTGEQTWEIEIDLASGSRLKLARGGSRLEADGKLVTEVPLTEYEQIYARFARMLDDGVSVVERMPLELVADAFMIGRRLVSEPFHD
jgi:D-galactose 1-dehydrogenase